MNGVTVAIVTKKRPAKLERCLQSIVSQTVGPDKILIIDNDPHESARPVCLRFKKRVPIVYTVEKTPNVPQARNKALSLCQTQYLAFVDDDCVAKKNWVEAALQSFRNHKQAAYIEGNSLLLNTKNTIAQALFYRQSYWFHYKLNKKTLITTPYNVDTKNVFLKASVLKKNRMLFDKSLYLASVGDHADVDLGFQLETLGAKGVYEPTMVVYHEEITTFRAFVTKAYERGRVGFLLYDKWGLSGELVFLPDIKLIKWIRRLKCWPQDFRLWTKGAPGSRYHKAVLFLLMKLYDRLFLQGFVDQARHRGKKLNFYETPKEA